MSSEHVSRLVWERGDRGFGYEQYSRTHEVAFGTGTRVTMSAAPEFRGDPSLPNPEELLVAALSSCHMLTFLAICARKGLVVERYEDAAMGVLERPSGRRMQVTKVTLRPRVTFAAGTRVDDALLDTIHHQSHDGCFIANSVKTEVVVERR